MIPLDLQSTLISEFKKLFNGELFPKVPKDTDDKPNPVPLNIFSQALPNESNGDLTLYFPYVIVQLQKGSQDDEIESPEAVIVINIGIYDDEFENQGHIFVCNIIEKMRQYLFLKRTFGNKYFIKLPFTWQVNDEDVWPYFFGGIETHWNIPVILPDDINL